MTMFDTLLARLCSDGIFAGALLALFALLAQASSAMARRLAASRDVKQGTLIRLIGSSLKVGFWVAGVAFFLGTLGVDVSAIIASLGLTGFALGFALKDVIANVLAGTMVLFYKPYGVGDSVMIMDSRGKVLDVNLRYTVLQAEDGAKHLIPNSLCLTNKIVILPTAGK